MKLKLVEKLEGYTGYMGSVEFVDGVSVRDVSMVESNTIAALTPVNWIKDGVDIGRAEMVSVAFDEPAPAATVAKPAPSAEPAPVVKSLKYDRAELEAIADKKGLSGLRAIGNEYGVRAKSIPALIDSILEAQQ